VTNSVWGTLVGQQPNARPAWTCGRFFSLSAKLDRLFFKNNSIFCYIPHVYSTFSSRRAAKSSGAVDCCWNWICVFPIVCVAHYLLFRSAARVDGSQFCFCQKKRKRDANLASKAAFSGDDPRVGTTVRINVRLRNINGIGGDAPKVVTTTAKWGQCRVVARWRVDCRQAVTLKWLIS